MNPTPCYLNTWKRFVREGLLDKSRLDKRVMESWHRCKQANVNPYLDKGQSFLEKELFSAQKKKYSLFLNTALPYLNKISQQLKESDMLALLIDADGYVLSLTGSQRTMVEARKINFMEGARWTETDVGTNAIGTALVIGEAVMINGTEHFSIASHHWSCSAAPIRDVDGTIIGVIDISCMADNKHPFMLGMASTVAYAIEREIQVQQKRREMELITHCLQQVEAEEPYVVCNEKKQIVSASRSIRERFSDWYGMDVERLKGHPFVIRGKQIIQSEQDGKMLGISLSLEEAAKSNITVSFAQFPGESGTSKVFQQTLIEMKRAAQTDANVYIWGETGTGKELAARAIHSASERHRGPFIAVNCGAIPESLLESELFGYAEGAFTGAKRHGAKGKFEQAHKGTLFLDEIGEIPYAMQVALLRVIEERKVVPLGGTHEIPLDIRIITATHRNMNELLKEGKIREDLYYRLHVYPINIPPLRERKEDIHDLYRYYQKKHQWNAVFPESFFQKLQEYHWPGNIRELFNLFEHIRVLFPKSGWIGESQYASVLEAIDQKKQKLHPAECTEIPKELTFRERIQKQTVIEALHKTKGHVSEAARLAGVPRSTFYKWMRKFKLS
ncbi:MULTISPECIES: sigma-54-dependent Fis family transcriptional regulator [Bacillus]|uniref:sigma-54-dependent Fis family transcriptional regulator n=1 Tax=Bacillus TaxID=1386 RepID=UPI00211200E4|nr:MULTISPECIES: sigma-54-dependent Fis family transcriptional regulator [Bacillus]MED1750265.1 sigma-54-dependent Fis family transcriptional regulator [Bacillus zhangzhouensis]UUD43221.1 sigma-54-dependent Fis family transcriptional regulator [Bacillus pumilus]